MNETRYTKNGEWVTGVDGVYRVGITQAVAEELGDVTFVELPALGRKVVAGEAVCGLEAVKAAADFYSPVSGTVVAVNQRLASEPQLLGTSPEGEGWLFTLGAVDQATWESLLDAPAWVRWREGT